MGVWGSAGSCWGPGDPAGAGSCCMGTMQFRFPVSIFESRRAMRGMRQKEGSELSEGEVPSQGPPLERK